MTFSIPVWLRRFASARRGRIVAPTPRERIRIAVDLADRNVTEGEGPFGALVTDGEGRLLGVGVNLVCRNRCSVLHAEIVALMMAQDFVGDYDLGCKHRDPVLATSVEPCAMCYGALFWSGIKRLECGATTRDALAIGFDEGSKPVDWVKALRKRGIRTRRNLRREEAMQVLQRYRENGGMIY